MPMTLPPPGRFSITSGWPSALLTSGSMMRARLSVPPPAPNGTTSRIGRVGIGLRESFRAERNQNAQRKPDPPHGKSSAPAHWNAIIRYSRRNNSSQGATVQHFNASDGLRLAYTIDDFTDPWAQRADAVAAACRDGAFQALLRLGAAPVPSLSRGAHGPARAWRVAPCRPPSRALSMERLVKDTAELLDHLGAEELRTSSAIRPAAISASSSR